jgi:hypothetical protein
LPSLVRLRFTAEERRSRKELVKSREAMVDQTLQRAMTAADIIRFWFRVAADVLETRSGAEPGKETARAKILHASFLIAVI